MNASYIVDFLGQCELLRKFSIGTDFMDFSDNYACIRCENSNRVIKKYCDGECVFGYEFTLTVRLSAKEKGNKDNCAFLEELAEWIVSQNDAGFLQNNSFLPVKIHLISGPSVCDDNAKSIKYKLKLRFDYIKRKEVKNNG